MLRFPYLPFHYLSLCPGPAFNTQTNGIEGHGTDHRTVAEARPRRVRYPRDTRGALLGAFWTKECLVQSYSTVGKVLAGVVGFEPTVHATKKRCLTTWLHPINEAVFTTKLQRLQAPQTEKVLFF